MAKPIFSRTVDYIKRYITGAPPENIPTLELKTGQETRESILEEVRTERQLNSDVAIWTLDAKDSFFKFLVSIDLAITGFAVALSASGRLHEIIKNEDQFKWDIRFLIIHFVICLTISAVWPRVISDEGAWRYIKYLDLLSRHLKLQNEYHDKKITSNFYSKKFIKLEAEKSNIFKERPRHFNAVRLFTLPWLWALILVVLLALMLSTTKYSSLII